MKMIMTFSILMMTMKHPLSMLLSVISLTLMISLFFYQNTCNSFIPLIIILLIMGGMLIIFMYMISLCPNKKFKVNSKNFIWLLFIFLMNSKMIHLKILNEDMMKIYCYPYMNMLLIMMIYLFINLMIMMKMLNWISSPMKTMTYVKIN
uniref:NADH dehydrogenase subunit 6 n=1 Tax=Amblyomma latum TaxID=34617 RepID=A0A977TQ32_9ACAR|nr:NADH dehydrogenase subunit 6 [Amblyomma latum]UXX50170.1 NADH dehydrogenase subunit 6 [Amblyomma latum]